MSSCLFSLLLLPAVLLPAAPSEPTFSLDRRQALTTSRVVGWPDPPPPYRTRRVFEKHSFQAPVYLISHPAHDLVFVVEQNGRVVHLPTKGDRKPEVFLKLEDADAYAMTFHPRYRTNKLVYVFSNGPNSKPKRKNQILRFRTVGDPPRVDPASRHLVIEWESNGHNGGDFAFGPDGLLYLTTGDGTSDSDTDDTGQDLRDLCSGVLRLDVDRPDSGKNYGVPKDNPFLKLPGARPELWAFGFRNPWRMTFDPNSGDLLIGDVGQDLWEMIRLVRKGSNHGWSVTEGSRPFHPNRKLGPGPVVPPLIEHPHSESRSITGGIVYQGKKFPDLRGVYVYGDYSTGKVWGLRQTAGTVTWKADLAQTRLQIVGIGADREGELYIVDHAGQIHQLEPSPPIKEPTRFPRTLSESGLFRSVKEYKFHPAVIPYSVNSPLWSDGASKDRGMAIPGTEPIGFTEQGPWQFPEQTVLVKTFSLETPEGRARRIETRFLTLQQGEWFGYSYAWDDDQNEARLVETGGLTRTFSVRDARSPGGKRDLEWRFPSRVECMVCHTRAAGYVLGLTTAQMNREHDYGGVRLNQLTALEKLGAFRVPRQRHLEALKERGTQLEQIFAAAARTTLAPGRRLEKYVETKSLQNHLATKSAGWRRRVGDFGGDTKLLFRNVEEYPRLVDPLDPSQDLTARVRSYLHANCSHCHVEAGGGNAAINLHVNTAAEKMKLISETPLHDRFGIAEARLVAPGAPERSVLYERLRQRGKGQMPPLATARPDEQAVELFREWILRMKRPDESSRP